MDVTSAVRTDTLPAVASVVLPGAAALAPYAAHLLITNQEARAFVVSHEATVLVGGIALAIGAGFLVESVGSYYEYYLIDRRHPNAELMIAQWYRYLRIAWKNEPIGQHYLRRVLAVFKFELNMFVAIAFALPGLVWLVVAGDLKTCASGWLVAAVVILGLYLMHAATETSKLLAQVRAQLLQGVGEPPFDDEAKRPPG